MTPSHRKDRALSTSSGRIRLRPSTLNSAPWDFGSVERPRAVSTSRHSAITRNATTATQSATMSSGLAATAASAPIGRRCRRRCPERSGWRGSRWPGAAGGLRHTRRGRVVRSRCFDAVASSPAYRNACRSAERIVTVDSTTSIGNPPSSNSPYSSRQGRGLANLTRAGLTQ
jgi:hypothetical protein